LFTSSTFKWDGMTLRAPTRFRAGPPRISRAIILGHRGEIEQARKLLQEQIHGASAEHIKYVQDIADRLNLGRIEPNRAEHC